MKKTHDEWFKDMEKLFEFPWEGTIERDYRAPMYEIAIFDDGEEIVINTYSESDARDIVELMIKYGMTVTIHKKGGNNGEE